MKHPTSYGICIAFFIVGIGVGYWFAPEFEMQQTEIKQSHGLGVADHWIDLRYLDGMIGHHLAAINLLEQAQQHSSRTELQNLATVVIAADRAGIEKLYAHKREWYGNTRQVTRYQQINLGEADERFDLRLLNALITHHQEAITMAKEISTKSTRTETLNIASDVQFKLSADLEQLIQWRKEWYGL